MALVSCDLAWEEEAHSTTTGSERTAWFKAFCSSIYDGDKAILLGAHSMNPFAPIVPFDPDPIFPARLVAESFPKRISGSTWFDVQVTYSTDIPFDENPLQTPAEVTIDFQAREIPSLFDVNGNPKINTAGDLLGDPISTVEVTDLIFGVTKNLPLDGLPFLLPYLDSVNSDTVRLRGLTLPPGTLRFVPKGVGKEENVNSFTIGIKNTPFTAVSFALLYRAQGWTSVIPNRGFNQLLPLGSPAASSTINLNANSAIAKILKKRMKPPKGKFIKMPILVGSPASPATEPQWLDVNGRAIPYPTPSNVVLLEWDDYQKKPFNQLPLR